jgi:hypothetical protein
LAALFATVFLGMLERKKGRCALSRANPSFAALLPIREKYQFGKIFAKD